MEARCVATPICYTCFTRIVTLVSGVTGASTDARGTSVSSCKPSLALRRQAVGLRVGKEKKTRCWAGRRGAMVDKMYTGWQEGWATTLPAGEIFHE